MRGKSGKTSGGQAGHAGDTLKQAATPDVIERHEAEACRHCLAGLTTAMMEQWAGQMRDLLLDANESVRAAVAEGAALLPTLGLRTLIKRYNAIVRRGLAFHRNLPPFARAIGARGRAPHRPGHNLLIRLHKFKGDVLRFLYDFAVPFTNNEAERDLRMMIMVLRRRRLPDFEMP